MTRWNSIFDAISTHFLSTCIVLKGRYKGLDKVFKVVNLYDPYGYSKPF
jgi:hypothetical protein